MAYQQFVVSDTNPNDNHGGGGCVCDPVKQIDCKPPYVVIYDTYLEDPRSPMVVICQSCADAFSKATRGEALSVGETNTYLTPIEDAEVVEDDELPEV